MDRKNRIVLTVLGALSLLFALIGATFAYFSAVSQSEPQIITTSSLIMRVTIAGSTNIKNIKPTTWSNTMSDNENNKDITVIPFVVNADAGVQGDYDINMSTVITPNGKLNGGNVSDIKYKLYKEGTMIKEGNFSSNFNEKIIEKAEILENTPVNDSYKLYVYIDNQNGEQNSLQEINFEINLTGEAHQLRQ